MVYDIDAFDGSRMHVPYTLDQLTAFVAVAETGSFTAAGRRIGRVQSAVSYAVGQLESALGSSLFDRSRRAPVLTDAGRRLLADARVVLGQARALSENAALLREGVESNVCVAVDPLYPRRHLAIACSGFARRFPSTSMRLVDGLLDDAVAAVRHGPADLGACNLAGGTLSDLAVAFLGTVQLTSVCSPTHPLAGSVPPQRTHLLEQFLQVVQTQRQPERTPDQGVLSGRTWRVTSLALKTRLICEGVGWGSLPASDAAPLIRDGVLVQLQPEAWPAAGHRLPLHAVSHPSRPLGPAAQWFRTALTLPESGAPAPTSDAAGS